MKVKAFKLILVGLVLLTSVIGVIVIIEIIFHYRNIYINRTYKCLNNEDINNTRRYLIARRLHNFNTLNEFHSASNLFDIKVESDKEQYLKGENIDMSLSFINATGKKAFIFPIRMWWIDMKDDKCITRIYLRQIANYDMKDLYDPIIYENINYKPEPFCVKTIDPKDGYIFKIAIKNNCDTGKNIIEVRIDGLGNVESKHEEDGMNRIIWGITHYKPFYIEYKTSGIRPEH